MHIALVTDYYLPTLGGVQTAIKAQKELLEQAGHTVTVFCPLHHESNDPTIVRLPTSRLFRPDNYPFTWSPRQAISLLTQEFAKRSIDIVHIHTEMIAAVAAVTAARSLSLPIVQSMHGRIDVYSREVLPLAFITSIPLAKLHNHYVPHAPYLINADSRYTKTALARRMWRLMVSQANSAQHVIVPSHHFAQKLSDQGVTAPLSVLTNNIEDTALVRHSARHIRQFDPAESPLRIMWCGRVSPEKRPLAFVKAVELLSDSVTADMYGDGVWIKKIRRYIKQRRLEHKITIHGGVSQDTVLAAMQDHHLFVSTSYDFDNQPMVMLEAVSTGLPVLYCDPDLAEVVPPKGSLCTASPTPSAIADAISLLLKRPTRIESMSKATYAYSQKAVHDPGIEPLVAIYKTLLP